MLPVLFKQQFKDTYEMYKNNIKLSRPVVLKQSKNVRKQSFLIEHGYFGETTENDVREGEGKQYFNDGSLFVGYFFDNECVKGNYYFSNGDMYQGMIVNQQYVKGKYIAYQKDFEYNGQFENDEFHDSKGRISWKSKSEPEVVFKFVGNFDQGRWHGAGKLQFDTNALYGVWKESKFTQVIRPRDSNDKSLHVPRHAIESVPVKRMFTSRSPVAPEGRPNIFTKEPVSRKQSNKMSLEDYSSAVKPSSEFEKDINDLSLTSPISSPKKESYNNNASFLSPNFD